MREFADSDSESGGSLSESAKRKRGSRAAAPKRSQVDIALEHVQEQLKSDDRQAAALMTAAGLVRQLPITIPNCQVIVMT